jgi:hypothetical protein
MSRAREEIEWALEYVKVIYELGGPPTDESPGSNWDAVEFHGLVLAALDDIDPDGIESFDAFLHDHRLHDVTGLRALLRLVASSAAGAALAWVLDVAPITTTRPITLDVLLAEASAIAWWGSPDD